jgi:hypothetical protein
MELYKRDTYLTQIYSEIKNKKALLIKKKHELDNKTKMNQFLSEVKDDYDKYHQYIVTEKQQQYNALLLLKEYMSDLMATENMVDRQMRSAKYDEKTIMTEIDKVKQELDEIMSPNSNSPLSTNLLK